MLVMPRIDKEQIRDYNREYYKNNKCEHGKFKTRCVTCGGGSLCVHGKQKPTCRECGGSLFCKHNRNKHRCKECKVERENETLTLTTERTEECTQNTDENTEENTEENTNDTILTNEFAVGEKTDSENSYNSTIIYKIVCKDSTVTDFYVGKTIDLKNRMRKHRQDSQRQDRQHLNLYRVINANGGWDNWNVVILETANLQSDQQARKLEHDWWKRLNPSLNHNQPLFLGLTNDEIAMEMKELGYTGLSKYKHYKLNQLVDEQEREIKRLKTILNENNIRF